MATLASLKLNRQTGRTVFRMIFRKIYLYINGMQLFAQMLFVFITALQENKKGAKGDFGIVFLITFN